MARDFDGSTGYLSTGATSALYPILNRWTLATFVNFDVLAGGGNSFGVVTHGFDGVVLPYTLAVAGADTPGPTVDTLFIGHFQGGWATLGSGFTPTLGRWYHVAGSLDGTSGTFRFYVDGKLVAHGAGGSPAGSNSNGVFLGRHWSSASPKLDGRMRSAAVWNRALLPDEIMALARGAEPLHLAGGAGCLASWRMWDYGSSGAATDRGPNALHAALTGTVNPYPGDDPIHVDPNVLSQLDTPAFIGGALMLKSDG